MESITYHIQFVKISNFELNENTAKDKNIAKFYFLLVINCDNICLYGSIIAYHYGK